MSQQTAFCCLLYKLGSYGYQLKPSLHKVCLQSGKPHVKQKRRAICLLIARLEKGRETTTARDNRTKLDKGKECYIMLTQSQLRLQLTLLINR